MEAANRFYKSLEKPLDLNQAELIDLFIYFLTVELEEPIVTRQAIEKCFELCDLRVPARIASHLSEGIRAKPPKFIKKDGGYRLERNMRESLEAKLGTRKTVSQTSAALRKLESKLQDGPKKTFLTELLDCFEAGANRAAIVMCWILTVDHLADHIFKHKLNDFNLALSKDKDKRIKVNKVTSREEFSDIPEGKLIELCRVSGIISKDVRKILDEKLGTRNSSAHPSSVTIKKSKVIDFVEDLVENVILKYPD
ncbi:MAG: hypothetical protein AB1814_09065 [Thermodesulfobacteriota bacterium]